MIKLLRFDEKHLERASEIYCRAYSSKPYFERINSEQAKEIIKSILISNNCLCFAIEHNSTIVGFILGFVQKGKRHNTFHIEEFIVDPEHQNKGIGSEALAMLEKILAEKGIYGITLLSHKKGAMEFFKKHGFKETNWVLMWKRLKNGGR